MTEACQVIRDRSELVAYFNRLAVGYRKPMAPPTVHSNTDWS